VVVVAVAVMFAGVSGCGGSSTSGSVPIVKADPKTLVLQPGDYPAAWTADPNNQPISHPLAGTGLGPNFKSKTRPLDGFSVYIPFQDLLSVVALYRSTAEAQTVFASFVLPATEGELSFQGATGFAFTIGDEQNVFAWDASPLALEVDLLWRSGNVIAWLAFVVPTNKNYPTPSALAADESGSDLVFFEQLAPRVQTHIRLASG
jgi:hypothetical protein